MDYLVDIKDVFFNLDEYLNIENLTRYSSFSSHTQELYHMIVNEALKFAQKTLAPLNTIGDREECRLEQGMVTIPHGFKQAYIDFAKNGFIGMDVPQTYGGQGLPVTITLASNEFIMGANYAFEMYPGLTRGAAHVIETFGPENLAKLFCEKMYSGQWTGTMCLTEPDTGSDVGNLRTTAKLLPDGTYSISGNKIFISAGDHDITENIIHLVLARVEGDQKGTKGISLFAVPKIWVNADGSLGANNDVMCAGIEHKLGIKGSATCSLNFGEKGTCRGFLVGERSSGMKHMFQMMNEARLFVGLQGLAISAAAYQQALKYAGERSQFGKTLLQFPDVRRNLMICKSLTEGMRGLIYKVALIADVAKNETDPIKKARAKNRVDLLTPICKAYCSDFGFRVTEIVLQIFGGYGYTSDYPAEQYLRDVKISSIYEGANGIQALDLVGRKLTKNGGQLFREFYEDVETSLQEIEKETPLLVAAQKLREAMNTLGQVAMKCGEWAMNGNWDNPQLAATPFLEICGHAALTYVLLEQAKISSQKLNQGKNKVFYEKKIKTALFFANEFLPLVSARAMSIIQTNPKNLEQF